MLDNKNFVKLAVTVAKADPTAPKAYSFGNESYSYNELQETLRNEFNQIAGTYQLYRENKNRVFSIMEETIDEIIPQRAEKNYMQFAEVKTFAQGDKPMFKRSLASNSRARAKQFITRVGLAGEYETFKLAKSTESFEVPTSAIGGAAAIGFEEFLDGRVDFAELIDIVMEGMDDLIFQEVGKALEGAVNQLPVMNRVTTNGFDETSFDNLVRVARAYGGEPTIYCTEEFATTMVPHEAWRYTEAMKDQLFRTGRVEGYKNLNIVILPNSWVDVIGGKEKVVDPSLAFIVGSGADSKPVKIAFEGGTLVSEREGRDWSREIQIYKKVGVVCMMNNAICVYKNEALTKNGDFATTADVHNVIETKDVTPKDSAGAGASDGGH